MEKALSHWPDLFLLQIHKAILLAELGQLDAARAVCRDSVNPSNPSAITVLMSAVCQEMLGDGSGAQSTIRDFADRLAAGPSLADSGQEGYAPALEYLLRERDASSLMATAGGSPGRRCEFGFLVAIRNLAEGDRSAGLAAIEECLGTGVFFFTQFRFAQVFVVRARENPGWPRWIE